MFFRHCLPQFRLQPCQNRGIFEDVISRDSEDIGGSVGARNQEE